jgi:hypothetical protein
VSPAFFCHVPMLPAVMVGESAGMLMTVWGGNAARASISKPSGSGERKLPTFGSIISGKGGERRDCLAAGTRVSR